VALLDRAVTVYTWTAVVSIVSDMSFFSFFYIL
jgi:hypothetical protein